MAPVRSDSEILEQHYNYELYMLANTYRLLEDNLVQQNALIESFCIHARNLIEFFRGDGRQYVETTYTPFAASKSRIKKLNPILNHQIAHLDVNNRTAKNSDKISDKNRFELITILNTETVEFQKHLKESYRGMSIRALMQEQIGTARPGSGANFPPSASSGATTTLPIGLYWSNDGKLVTSGGDSEDR
jgi:hypothetical protein